MRPSPSRWVAARTRALRRFAATSDQTSSTIANGDVPARNRLVLDSAHLTATSIRGSPPSSAYITVFPVPREHQRRGPAFRHPGHPGRRELDLDSADHRDGRHDRRPVAAVLSAVQHHRQADHAAMDQLRTPRHLDRCHRGGGRRGGSHRVSAFAFRHTHYFGQFSNAGATATGLDHVLGSIPAALFAVVLLNASLIGAGALTLDQLRVRGRLPWLNVLAIVIVAVLVLLSLILMATTAFPNIDVTAVALGGGAVLAVGLSVAALLSLRSRRRGGPRHRDRARSDRSQGAVDDATPRLPRASGLVHQSQNRDAHAPRIPRRIRRSAHRQGGPAQRRITP